MNTAQSNLELAFAKYHEGDQAAADWLVRVATVQALLALREKPAQPAPVALSPDDIDTLADTLFDLIRSDKQSTQNAMVDLLRFVFSKEDK
jgi:hypothetical protein